MNNATQEQNDSCEETVQTFKSTSSNMTYKFNIN